MSRPEHDRRIDYIELPVRDIADSKRFYSSVFGWEFTDYGPEYTSFSDGRLAGGFFRADTVQPGGALLVIYARDLESLLATVRGNGAEITREIFAFPGGRRFHFRDPSGHELAVWSQ